MHATPEELITLRDGELLDANVVLHVAECRQCGLVLARLRARRLDLQRLPVMAPPPAAWQAIEARLARPAATRVHPMGWSVAAAAVVALAVGLYWTAPRSSTSLAAANGATTGAAHDAAGAATAAAAPSVAALVARSQQLEDLLKGLPRRPAVERATTSAAIDALQSRIQALDVQLASTAGEPAPGDRAQRLWSDRVQLMSSLLDVRFAEATRHGYHPSDTQTLTGAI